MAACTRKTDDVSGSGDDAGDWVQADDDATPEEKRYLEIGRALMLTVCARDYEALHARLSSHAVARISLNQCAPADDDTVFERQEAEPRRNVGAPEFRQLMAGMEERFGSPARPLGLHIHSTDPEILAGTKTDGFDAIDVMLAIGNMPATIPAGQRRASLRGQIAVQLSPAQLAEAAKAYEVTPEELVSDPDFEPYLNLKLVLVEENGELRLGYFEFLPPSMLD